ncbi:putative multidrug resistance efflux transporter [Pontibacter ummariensis]|uniref:Putative multidrug resistance efflux transporter n=1 Tax=Pontibacter ummariensis TaxID=1610492 RepID=A0A239L9V2_9BACT|nr:multidrug resistance efflux transporter family protein [Pontibacter ummariensis]PRY03960.1 putative multidrug resistance efflux transporter [Pontibacter ummariensis]SNT27231.1 Putative multidrug resistance efflux transporter [Pontibacter ummariensis]
MQRNSNTKAIALGSLACVFFSATYVLNSFLSAKGGHWAWTTGLRSFFLMLLLVLLLSAQGQLKHLLWVMRQNLQVWLVWGGVAFGLSYYFLTFAASFGPGWLVAGAFQFTIVAGILLSPFLYKDHRAKIPVKALLLSLLIMAGIACMQWSQKNGSYSQQQLWWCVGLVMLAAFSWPLANRKLLLYVEESKHPLNAIQRVAGTALGSFPFQLIMMGYGYSQAGLPGQEQLLTVLLISLSSGVIGCILFFRAMHLARLDATSLAAVEATQSIEIVFTVIGEVLLLGIRWPNWIGNVGMLLVVFGLVLYSIPSRQKVLQIAEPDISPNQI